MEKLKTEGSYEINGKMKENLSDFYGGYAKDEKTLEAIKEIYDEHGYVIDTHTAVGYYVYEQYVKATSDKTYTLIASTASPFKFTRSVVESIYGESQGYNDFELIDVLSEKAGLDVPKTIKDIDKKEIRHKAEIDKNQLMENIRKVLR